MAIPTAPHILYVIQILELHIWIEVDMVEREILPYVGITKSTCDISNEVRGKDILLIDDIYTSGVYIDEDAIQALLDHGARDVYFYAVGKTYKGGIKHLTSEECSDNDLPF